jgi:hypothetical protein
VHDVAGVLGTTEGVIERTYGHHAHGNLKAFSHRATAYESPMKRIV